MPKVLCTAHNDTNPSMEVYPDGWGHCFVCGYRAKIHEVENKGDKYVEDIRPTVDYISKLKNAYIRQLLLPCDDTSYYILWPNKDYYKYSRFDRGTGPKYLSPSGVTKPLFEVSIQSKGSLVVCEGELNALSLALVTSMDVVSPGGSGDFYSKRLEKDLTLYRNYDSFILVVDNDPAGVLAAIELKSRLKAEGKVDIAIHLMEKDANDILVQDGIEKLKEKAKQMGMC